MKRKYILLILISITASVSQGQIRITSANIDTWIKANLSGQGVVVGNIKHHGNPISQGAFTSSGNVLQVQKGLVLSTGNVFNISGFNNSYNQSTALGNLSEPETDIDLGKLLKGGLYDISYVEFDFVPMGNSVQFNYQFGSDEYPEYVGSAYNDIFAFFISDETSTRNIALIPGKSIPVSINTVNSKTDSAYFIDNNPFSQVVIKRQKPIAEKVQRSFFGGIWYSIKSFFGSSVDEEGDRTEILPDPALVKKLNSNLYRNLQYDGITKKLVAQAYVEPYKKYHLKIIIADVSDNIYDSGVFIEDRSLTAKRDTLQPGYVAYPDLTGILDPKLILEGKRLADVVPASAMPKPVLLVPATTASPTLVRTAPLSEVPKMESLQDVVIYFDFDRSDISPTEMDKLKIASVAYNRMRSIYKMSITGHTDNKGSLNYNYALSKRRNEAVKAALNALNPLDAPSSVIEKAYLLPIANNGTDNGRQMNRRVVISFKKK